ncbi:MAG: hypothetical protein ACRDKZ_12055 [Actinomycetota bacterium]
MNLDKLLRESLKQAGESYEPDRHAEARAVFARRLRRRRIVFAGSVALAGAGVAALVALVALNPPTVRRTTPDVAGPVRVTDVVEVGAGPDGVAAGAGAIWVANSGDGTVSRIDPDTNDVAQTIEVGGSPEDLAVTAGVLWVGDAEAGTLARIDVSTGDPAGAPARIPGAEGTSLDLAATRDAVWVVSRSAGLYRVDAETGEALGIETEATSATDVAVGGGSVWVLDDEQNRLVQVDQTSGNPIGTVPLDLEVSGANGDLAVGGGGVWIADGESRSIFRLDLQVGARTAEISFTGSYASLHVQGDSVWVLTGGNSGTGTLLLVDATTGAEVGDPLPLEGGPLDLVIGGDAVWVTNADAGEVTRIEGAATRAPGERPFVQDQVPPDQIVYVYAAGGDIFARLADGSERPLVATSEFEGRATWLEQDSIIFQRGGEFEEAASVVLLALDPTTGEETSLGAGGRQSAFGLDGRAAWIVPSDDLARQTEISAGPSMETQTRFFAGNPAFDPLDIDNLEWDVSGARLYYEAGYERRGLYAVDVEVGDRRRDPTIEVGTPRPVAAARTGAAYLAPSSSADDEVAVVRVCCRRGGSPYRQAELGLLEFGGPTARYTKIAGLDDIGFDVNVQELTLESAGTLDVESSATGEPMWTISSTRSWIVGDGRNLWLIDEDGEADGLEGDVVGSVAVNPALLP